jgi:cob(I)alamin adenosyltransferase
MEAAMPRITKVRTRTGDDGTTALGSGTRVSKADPRIEAYGTVDELNAQIGVVQAAGVAPELADPLRQIQNDLFHLGAELCIPEADRPRHSGPRIEPRHIEFLDRLVDRFNAQLTPLKNFVLPGGALSAAQLHVARTVCRRAEREVIALAGKEPVGPHVVMYLNRLSDVLFILARYQNKAAGVDEPTWDSRA